MLRRRFVAALVAIAVSVVGFVPASAQDEGTGNNDNTAVAINTKDGSDLFRLAFAIDRVMVGEDQPDNGAAAYASCEACKTTAIAIQVVLYMSPTDDEIAPTNIALAINDQCTSCETVALAYQIVMQTDGPVKLTKNGKEQIKRILKDIRALEDQDLSPDELKAQTDVLVDELVEVLKTEVKPKQQRDNEDSDADVGPEPGEDPGAEASFDPSQTSTPDATPDVDGSPEPSADPPTDPSPPVSATDAPAQSP
jgi:putative peptide zinc metalloprotease protein